MSYLLRIVSLVALALLVIALVVDMLIHPLTIDLIYRYHPTLSIERYGLLEDERLTIAQKTLPVVGITLDSNQEMSRYLSKIHFSDGSSVYTEQEISHLLDLRNILTGLRVAGLVCLLFGVFYFMRTKLILALTSLLRDLQVLFIGSILLFLMVLFLWQHVFIGFHHLFFPQGNWTFSQSSSLIRLFPEDFWFTVGIALIFLSWIVLGLFWMLVKTMLTYIKS